MGKCKSCSKPTTSHGFHGSAPAHLVLPSSVGSPTRPGIRGCCWGIPYRAGPAKTDRPRYVQGKGRQVWPDTFWLQQHPKKQRKGTMLPLFFGTFLITRGTAARMSNLQFSPISARHFASRSSRSQGPVSRLFRKETLEMFNASAMSLWQTPSPATGQPPQK